MKKEVVTYPSSSGPYLSNAKRAGQFLFLQGQTGKGPDIKTQTRNALEHLKASVELAGTSMENVVQNTVYFVNMENDYDSFNQVYKEFFPNDPPVRSCIEVPRAAHQKGCLVKISVIAFVP